MTETEIIKEKKRNIYSSFFSEDYVSKFLFKSILHHVISLEIYENNRLDYIRKYRLQARRMDAHSPMDFH